MRALADSLFVAFGAALGANARYWIGVAAKAQTQSFPWPTLLINTLGSLLLGAFAAIALAKGWGHQSRLFFAVGLCGGFTTFSTFSFESLELANRSLKAATIYIIASLILCVGGCLAGGHFSRVLLTKVSRNVTGS